jgi:hypothetical protein
LASNKNQALPYRERCLSIWSLGSFCLFGIASIIAVISHHYYYHYRYLTALLILPLLGLSLVQASLYCPSGWHGVRFPTILVCTLMIFLLFDTVSEPLDLHNLLFRRISPLGFLLFDFFLPSARPITSTAR